MEVKINVGDIKISLETTDLKQVEDLLTNAFRRAGVSIVSSCIKYGFIREIAAQLKPATPADLFKGAARVVETKPAPPPPAPQPYTRPPVPPARQPWGDVDLATGEREQPAPPVTRLPERPAAGLGAGLRPQPRDIPPHDPVPPAEPLNGDVIAPPAFQSAEQVTGRLTSVGLLCPTVAHRPDGYILTSEAYEMIGGTSPSAVLNEWIRNKKIRAVVVAGYKPPTKGLKGRLMVDRATLEERNAMRKAHPHHVVAHSGGDNAARAN